MVGYNLIEKDRREGSIVVHNLIDCFFHIYLVGYFYYNSGFILLIVIMDLFDL